MNRNNLPTISETSEQIDTNAHVFSWLLQHPNQIIDLTLNILITQQIESCLSDSKEEEMRVKIINKLKYKFN